jgi:hypothetical protein
MSEKACYLCIHRIKANTDEPCIKCLEFRTQYPYFVAVNNSKPVGFISEKIQTKKVENNDMPQ